LRTIAQATEIVLKHEISETRQNENLYFNFHWQSLIYKRKAEAMAETLGIEDAKLMFIRNKAAARYQQLPNDEAKAAARKMVHDALIIMRAWDQGFEIVHNTEVWEADDKRKEEIKAADRKYRSPEKVSIPKEGKGLAAKTNSLFKDKDAMAKILAEIRKG
jgi:hypothetical protein